MPHESENQMEETLLGQLGRLGFAKVVVSDREALDANMRAQLEVFNDTKFSDAEFAQIWNHLQKGDRFEKAKKLRDGFLLTRDDENTTYVWFFNVEEWCKNEYQVAQQVTQTGKYENRYDVTLLVNGLPLVQVELKRRGVELKEAFNQVQRYHKHSFAGTLFDYVQVFVISNGVNTKYFANNPKQSFEQTFYWADEENRKVTKLEDFTEHFLEKCMISKVIAEYIVLAEALRIPMVMRPYQYYAVQRIIERVKNTEKNGYIWHTTGSGKTLTSYKASQILSRVPEVKKVLFVVDRKDLDTQTVKEFNSFSAGAVDGTDKTKTLVDQLSDPNRKLIVTTIQKLDLAVSRQRHLERFAYLKDEKVVMIFDECHRGHFGDTHARIKSFFENSQLFGFTGTPIFAENHMKQMTTADMFGEALHKYTITNAISDANVLGFAVEYVGRYTQKESDVVDADIAADVEVERIDTREVLESDARLSKIADYVLSDWKRKTKAGKFNAMFAVSNVDVLKKYYTLLKEKKPEDFKVATIFTYQANEDNETDMLEADTFVDPDDVVNEHSRDFLENCIADYNAQFGTNYSTNDFYGYYRDLQNRIKNKEVDLVLVVNIFLTGFDSPRVNTLYVDKNLRYHGLIQAYSRTNRILNADKPHGNIVVFRNLKDATDKALALYGDENAKEVVFKKPYDTQGKEFEEAIEELREVASEPAAVSDLESEEQKHVFVEIFRKLLRQKASLETFAEFTFADFGISEQEFYDFQSKYLDLYEEQKRRTSEEAESVLDQVDFELELTVRDVVNFDYIIKLIAGLANYTSDEAREKRKEEILKIFDRDVHLRKKKDLIRKFIEENMPKVSKEEDVEEAFEAFWSEERAEVLREIAEDENLDLEKLNHLVGEYLYTQHLPSEQDIIATREEGTPGIMQRRGIVERIRGAISDLVETFEW